MGVDDRFFNWLIGLKNHIKIYEKTQNEYNIGLGTDTDQLEIQSKMREKIQVRLGGIILFCSILIIGIDFFTYDAFIEVPDLGLKSLIIIKLFLWLFVVWVTHRVIVLPEKITDIFKKS